MKTFEITSLQNDLIKYVVKLQDSKFRKSENLILVDGAQTIEGFINDKVIFKYLFLKKENSILNFARAENIIFVTDDILKKISTTKSSTDVIGVIEEPVVKKEQFKNMHHIALIDGIKDAGNLGTIIRSAVAFSIDGIILFNDCVDLYNSKTIRATAQNIFKIPILRTKDIDFINELRKSHKLISTVVDSDIDFDEYNFNGKFMIAFGSEANGISDDIKQISDEKITISMDNGVESLNLGVCASVVFSSIRNKNKSK